jgi:lysophospholipase L1-like esterase
MKTIVFIGDSITEGEGDDQHSGWTRRVAQHLPKSWRAIHSGVGGNTILNVLARLKSVLLAYDPTVIVLGIGINDSRKLPSRTNSNEVPLAEFEKGMDRFAEIIQNGTIRTVIIVGLTPVDEERSLFYEDDHLYTNEAIQKYDSILREISIGKEFVYVATFDEFVKRGGAEILTVDGLHPNPQGHQLIADLMAKTLVDQLQGDS